MLNMGCMPSLHDSVMEPLADLLYRDVLQHTQLKFYIDRTSLDSDDMAEYLTSLWPSAP